MRHLLFLILSTSYLHLSAAQYLTAVAFCTNGMKMISDGCFMTVDEAEMDVLPKCYPDRDVELIDYNFADIDSCQDFRSNYLTSFTKSFTQVQQQQDTTATNQSNTTVTASGCGCKDIVKKIVDVFVDKADSDDDLCVSIADDFVLGKIGKVCPDKEKSLLNFFLGKVCDFTVNELQPVIDKAFIKPICTQVEKAISVGLGVPLKYLNSSLSDTADRASQLVCGALFCQQKDSNLCTTATNFEPKGVWGKALTLTNFCPKDSSGNGIVNLNGVNSVNGSKGNSSASATRLSASLALGCAPALGLLLI